MLRVGFFEDFNEEDTLLIWGDEHGLARFQLLLGRLSSGASTSAPIHETRKRMFVQVCGSCSSEAQTSCMSTATAQMSL